MIALIARQCGLDAGDGLSAAEFRDSRDLARLPKTPVVFTPEADDWLRARAR